MLGIDDDRGELMVVINWNTDLGDAWEWAEHPYYPLKFSTYAVRDGREHDRLRDEPLRPGP